MADKTLSLGTLFRADVADFVKNVNQARNTISAFAKDIDRVLRVLSKIDKLGGARGFKQIMDTMNRTGGSAKMLYGELTELEKALGRTEKLGGKYSTTLKDLTKGMDQNSLGIKDAEKAMYATDKALRQLNRSYFDQLKQTSLQANNWGVVRDSYVEFMKAADLNTISQKVLAGRFKATEKEIKPYIQQVTNGKVAFENFTNAKQKSWPIIEKINRVIDEGSMSWQKAARMQAAYFNSTIDSSKKMTNLADRVKDAQVQGKSFSERIKKDLWPQIDRMNRAIDEGGITWQEAARKQAAYYQSLEKTVPIQQKIIKNSDEIRRTFKTKWPIIDKVNKAIDNGTMSWQQASIEQAKFMANTQKSTKQATTQTEQLSSGFKQLTAGAKGMNVVWKTMNKAVDEGTMSWQKMARIQAQWYQNQKPVKQVSQDVESLSQKFKQLTSGSRGMGTVWRTMNKAVDDGLGSWQEMARIQAQWQKDNIKALSGVRRTKDDIERLNQAVKPTPGLFENIARSLKDLTEYGIAATIIYKITEAFRAGAAEIINYDQALKNIQAISGATNGELEIMDGVIRRVARDTKFSAVEIGDAMVLLTQSGFDAAESISSIKAVADLATGTLSKMETTADLLTTTIRAFNLEAIESGRVSDIMATAINKSKLTIEKLRVAFNYVGAVAGEIGISVEETAASLMVLANHGLRASTMGTGLRLVLSKLMSPTKSIRDAFEENGIALADVNPQVVGFQKAMQNLQLVLMDEKGVVNMTKAFELFGLRGANAASVLSKAFGPSGEFTEALENVYRVGSSAEMAGIQAEGLGVKIKNLVDRAKAIALAFGDAGITGVLKVVIDVLRGVTEGFLVLTETVGGSFVLKLVTMTTIIYGLSKAFLMLANSLSIAVFGSAIAGIGTMTLQSQALAGVLSKIGTVIASIVASKFFLVTAAIVGTSIAIHAYSNRLKNARKEHEKLSIAHKGTSNSLNVYISAIEKTNGEGEEYESLVKRLKEAHPELSKAINETSNSYSALLEKMKEIRNEEMDKSFVESFRQIAIVNKEIRGTYNRLAMLRNLSGVQYAPMSKKNPDMSSFKSFLETNTKAAEKYAQNLSVVDELARGLYDKHGFEKLGDAKMNAVRLMKDAGYDAEKIEENMALIEKSFMGFEKHRKEFQDRRAHEFKLSSTYSEKQLEQERKFTSAMADMTDDRRKKIDLEFEKRVLDADKWYDEEVENSKKAGAKAFDAEEKYGQYITGARQEKHQALIDLERTEKQELLSIQKDYIDQMQNLTNNQREKIDLDYTDRGLQNEQKHEKAIKLIKMRGLVKSEETKLLAEEDQKYVDLQKANIAQKNNELQDLESKHTEKILSFQKQYYDKLGSMASVEKDKIEMEAKERAEEFKKMYAEELKYRQDNGLEISEMKQRYNTLEIESEKKKNADLLKLDFETKQQRLSVLKSQADLDIEQQTTASFGGGGAGVSKLREIKETESKIEQDHLKRIVDLYEKYYKDISGELGKNHKLSLEAQKEYNAVATEYQKSLTKTAEAENKMWLKKQKDSFNTQLKNVVEFSEEWKSILEQMFDLEIISGEEFQDKMNDAFEFDFANAEKAFILGKMKHEEFMEYLKLANEKQLIDSEELARRRIEVEGTFFQKIKRGIEDAELSYGSWGSFIINTSAQVTDAISGGFSDAFIDFVNGTKSAKESFTDFARSTLDWLAKMLMRMAIMKLIGMAIGAFNAGSGSTTTDFARPGEMVNVSHQGGTGFGNRTTMRRINKSVMDFAPRFHNGLAPDEFPAILQTGERVLNRAETKNYGGGSLVLSITNNVTVDGGSSGNKSDAEMTGKTIGRALEGKIIETIRNQQRPGGVLAKFA